MAWLLLITPPRDQSNLEDIIFQFNRKLNIEKQTFLTSCPAQGIFRVDATAQFLFWDFMSHVTSVASESGDAGFSVDTMVMTNAEHCRSEANI